MILGKKQLVKFKITLICLILLLFGYLLCQTFNKKEGVIFTKFDNRTFFTKPWDDFCIPTAPSCQQPFLEKPGMIGVFPIGCNCEKTAVSKSPPAIPESCYEIDHSYYYK
jgi:hypothetical protein